LERVGDIGERKTSRKRGHLRPVDAGIGGGGGVGEHDEWAPEANGKKKKLRWQGEGETASPESNLKEKN